MNVPVKIVNLKTGIEFDNPNHNLVAYAKSDKDTFKIYYEEDGVKEKQALTDEGLRSLSIPDLRVLAEGLDCDKRSKESLIDAILKDGR